MALPLHLNRVECGFPSPAEDHLDQALDLNEHLIEHPAATYFARASGESLSGYGILSGDLLIVDRAREPVHQDVVVVSLDGELTCKILDLSKRQLLSANPNYPPVPVPDEMDMIVEGVVTHAVHYLRGGG